MKRSRGFLAICRTLNYFKDSLLLLFWMLPTCHTPGQIYKLLFLQCPARCRRLHLLNWIDLTPPVTASFPGLLKCRSLWSLPWCHSCARPRHSLALLTPGEGSTTVSSPACQKKWITEPQVGCALQQPK